MGAPVDDTTVHTLSIKDDKVLMTRDIESMEYMNLKLIQVCEQWELKANTKTAYMCVEEQHRTTY